MAMNSAVGFKMNTSALKNQWWGGVMTCSVANRTPRRSERWQGITPFVDVGRSDGGARNEARYAYLKEVFNLPPTQR
jgi:hypothetical protein